MTVTGIDGRSMDTRIIEQEKTIPSLSVDGKSVQDYNEVRQDFRIYPGEDGLKYQDLKLLGMGGMGIVYSGEDPTLERRVAIKILREPFRNDRIQIAKFINEARITARIDHPNVVAVHQLGINAHHGVYFSMRQISGETLLHVIRRLRDGDKEARQHYTTRRLLDIFIAGCNAVAAAHGKNILHCDLKPANIMIGKFGETLVLDWGLAREAGEEIVTGSKVSGTPAYMAPELLSGELLQPDEKSDIYALGAILFSILTWQDAPFDLTSDNDTIAGKAVLGKTLPLRAPGGQSLSRELAAICRKAMARDRKERYATVTELLTDLYNYRDNRPVKAYSPNVFYRFFKLCLRRPAIPIAVIVALLTLGVYSIWETILAYTEDRSLLHSANVNFQMADDYYRRSVALHGKTHNGEILDDPVKITIAERNVLLQSNLAMMEFFSILDSSISLSPAGQEKFIRKHAATIFKNIISLQLMAGEAEKMDMVLERCRRWPFFDEACRNDAVLAKKVRQIGQKVGSVFLQSDSAGRKGKLKYPDGSVKDIEVNDNSPLELPAGDYQLLLADGVKARFQVLPGADVRIYLPAALPSAEEKVIPQDHFFLEIPGSGNVRCLLPAFVIRKYSGRGYFTKERAAMILKGKNTGEQQWRLPHAAELMKVWSDNNFYGVEKSSGPVLLHNGDLFDPATLQIIKNNSGRGGELYLIREL